MSSPAKPIRDLALTASDVFALLAKARADRDKTRIRVLVGELRKLGWAVAAIEPRQDREGASCP